MKVWKVSQVEGEKGGRTGEKKERVKRGRGRTSGAALTILTLALESNTNLLYPSLKLKYPLVQSNVVSFPPGAVASLFAVRKISGTTREVSCEMEKGPSWRTGRREVSKWERKEGRREEGREEADLGAGGRGETEEEAEGEGGGDVEGEEEEVA